MKKFFSIIYLVLFCFFINLNSTNGSQLKDKLIELKASLTNLKLKLEMLNDKLGKLSEQIEEAEEGAPEKAEEEGEEADDAAEELSKGPTTDVGSALLAFAREFKTLSVVDITAIEKLAATEFAHHGGHGHGGHGGGGHKMGGHHKGGHGRGGPHGGMHGMCVPGSFGRYCPVTLTALVAELKKPANATVLPQPLKFQLIRWAWRIVWLQGKGELKDSMGPLVQKAQVIINQKPKEKGHCEFPPCGGRGRHVGPGGGHPHHGGSGGPGGHEKHGGPGGHGGHGGGHGRHHHH